MTDDRQVTPNSLANFHLQQLYFASLRCSFRFIQFWSRTNIEKKNSQKLVKLISLHTVNRFVCITNKWSQRLLFFC